MPGEINPKLQGSVGSKLGLINHSILSSLSYITLNPTSLSMPTQSLVIGDSNTTNDSSNIIIGYKNSVISQSYIGTYYSASGNTIIGNNTIFPNGGVQENQNVIIGGSNSVQGNTNVIIGQGNNNGIQATDSGNTINNTVVIGNGAYGFGISGVAIGYQSYAGNASGSTASAVACGPQATAYSNFGIAIGAAATTGAQYSVTGSIAIGHGASTNGSSSNYAVSLGAYALATGQAAIAIGGGTSGTYNNASGNNSIAIGSAGTNTSATAAIAIGYGITASAINTIGLGYSFTLGGANQIGIGNLISTNISATGTITIGLSATTNNASAIDAIAIGHSSKAVLQGQFAYGLDNLIGTSTRSSFLKIANQTTGNTQTTLFLDGVTGTKYITLQLNSINHFRARIIGKVTGAADAGVWTIEGAIQVGASAATAALVGTPTVNVIGLTSGASSNSWGVTSSANTSNPSIDFKVTGQSSTTIDWFGSIELTELAY